MNTKRHFRWIILSFVLLAALLAGSFQVARAATNRYVDASIGVDAGDCSNNLSPCLTISYAVTQSVAGDTIYVAAGNYTIAATIVLDRALTISGPAVGGGGAKLEANTGLLTVFDITSSDVTVENLEITAASAGTFNTPPDNELNTALIKITTGTGMSGIVITGNSIYVPTQSGAMSTWNARAITAGTGTVAGLSITGNSIYNTRNGVVVQYNNSATISNNSIYNTKGGIMNYTGSQVDADNRTMSNNTWGPAHNEWDIVWNSGAYYVPDYQVSVLALSGANNNAYVLDRRAADAAAVAALTGNRSHVFVDAASSIILPHPARGNYNEPFGTIQLGIDAVVPGGTIYVAAGTYTERVTINKSLSLLGAQVGINPTPSGARTTPAAESIITEAGLATPNPDVLIEIPSGVVNVIVDGFTLNGDQFNTTADTSVLRIWGNSITVQNNIIDGMYSVIYKGGNTLLIDKNRITANKTGVVVQPSPASGVTVSRNTLITGMTLQSDPTAVNYSNCTNCSLSNNTAVGWIVGTGGRAFTGSAVTNLTVDGNVFTNNNDGISIFGASTFIDITNNILDTNTRYGINIKGQDFDILNNQIHNNGTSGINIEKHVLETERVKIFGNSISGNLNYGVFVKTGVVDLIDASGNYWGVNTTTGVKAAANGGVMVDYTPWLASGSDTGDPGFQGDFSSLWVDDDSPQTGSTGRIQEGINLVSGSTVNVAAGTYDETINIVGESNLIIDGEDKNTTIIKPSTTIGWGLHYGTSRNTAVRVETSTGITMKDLTIDLDLVKGNNISAYFGWNSTGTLDNNIIKNSSLPDSVAYYELGVYIRAPGYTAGSRAAFSVLNNTFYNAGRVSLVTHDYLNTTISGNTFYKDMDDFGYGIEMGSTSIGSISGNTFYGFDTPAASDGSESAAIYIENAFTGPAFGAPITGVIKTVLVENNEIYDCQYGMWIGNGYDDYAGDVDIVVTLNNNDLHDNTEGAAWIQDEDKEHGSSVTVTGSGNTLTDNGTYGYYIYSTGDGDLTVSLEEEEITGHTYGVKVVDTAGGSSSSSYSVSITESDIYGNTTLGMQNSITGLLVDAETNWWGSACGPTGAGANGVSGNVDYSPWWTAPGGLDTSYIGTGGELVFTTGSDTASMQAIVDCAAPGSTLMYESGGYPGGLVVNTNNLTFKLNSLTVGPGSPAYTINADDVTILGPGVFDGTGGSPASPAIVVNAGADNFTLEGTEIKNWTNGVQLTGSVASFKVVKNWIHGNSGSALFTDSGTALSGVVTIEGNLFKENTGNGITHNGTGTLMAEYNSWGDYAGPNSGVGDGASAGVDFIPWTYSEVFVDMIPDTNAALVGVNETNNFNVAVKVDAKNLYAVQYRLAYETAYLQFQGISDGPFKGSGSCMNNTVTPGVVSVYCTRYEPDDEVDNHSGETISTITFKAVGGITGNGPWTTHLDLSVLPTELSSGAKGGIKVFVNNGGFGAASTTARDITDTQDGQVTISGLAQFTGYIDLQGRANDSGGTLKVYNQQLISGATVYASGTSASSGKFTTANLSPYQLTVPSTYYFQVDAPLFLPTTAIATSPSFPSLPTNWVNGDVLDTRALTSLLLLQLLGGDANDNNVIDTSDLGCIGGAFGGAPAACGTGSSDVNGDGVVNIFDLVLVGGNYDKTSSGGWYQIP